jgi:hypothetical protein
MRWVRSHRRPSCWVALLALVLQLGLSFGHVHSTYTGQPTAALTAPAASTGTGDHNDTDYCATCAILALLAGTQTASTPAVAVPTAVASGDIVIAPDAVHIPFSRGTFRSRDPPHS